MTFEELKKNKFNREYRPIKYNPIRPLVYPDHERTLLGDTAVKSNVIGTENDRILGMFFYDAK